MAAASEFEYGVATVSYKESLIGKKKVGPAVLAGNMKLIGMSKCG